VAHARRGRDVRMCVCVETTGTIGCRGDGTPPDPMPDPDPDPGPVGMPPLMTDSESIGSTNSGRQERSMRIPSGVGYIVADTGRDAYFGTEETIYWLRTAFDRVAVEHPGAALTQVRDISIELGGVPSGAWPHSSHRSGRDVDATYWLDSCSATSGCPLGDVALADFDAAATWTAFKTWIDAGVITYIFVDHALQRPLYEEAMARGATAAQLTRWFQYPRSADERVGLIRHVDNHRNHFHVRFTCPADDLDCIE
jgi:murein endopeptidase